MNHGNHVWLRRFRAVGGLRRSDLRPPVEAQRRNPHDELVRRRRTEEYDGAAAPRDDVRIRCAKQGSAAVIGLAYWAITNAPLSAQEVGIAAAAASTGLLLVAIGALGIPLLLLAELEQTETSERRVMFTTGTAIAAFVVLIFGDRHHGPVALPREESAHHR